MMGPGSKIPIKPCGAQNKMADGKLRGEHGDVIMGALGTDGVLIYFRLLLVT